MDWDPLCGSHDQLIAAQSSLSQLLRQPDGSGDVLHWKSYQETFCVEPSLFHDCEYTCLVCGSCFSFYIVVLYFCNPHSDHAISALFL